MSPASILDSSGVRITEGTNLYNELVSEFQQELFHQDNFVLVGSLYSLVNSNDIMETCITIAHNGGNYTFNANQYKPVIPRSVILDNDSDDIAIEINSHVGRFPKSICKRSENSFKMSFSKVCVGYNARHESCHNRTLTEFRNLHYDESRSFPLCWRHGQQIMFPENLFYDHGIDI